MPTLARYQSHVTDTAGNVVASPTVEVRDQLTDTLASLFSDRDSLNPLTNPFVGGADGLVKFHVSGGAYKITALAGDEGIIQDYVAIGTAQEYDVSQLAAAMGIPAAELKAFHATNYGVKGDGVTDDTLALQAAIDAAHLAGGGIVLMPAGTLRVSAQGTIGGRAYCVLMKSNVVLVGSSWLTTTVKFNRTATDTDIIRTGNAGAFGAWTQKNMGLRDFTIDGDSPTAGAGNGFNLWMLLVQGLWIENVRSLNSTNMAMRVDNCQYVTFNGIKSEHDADPNADAVHFIDTIDVVGTGINIYTEGDDAFVIEAVNQDVENYNISGLICEAPTGGIAAGRGILLLRDETLGAGVARTMRSINIFATCTNCYGSAVNIGSSLRLEAVSIDVSAVNCGSLITAYIGLVAHPTYMRGCTFNLRGSNFTGVAGNPVAVFSPADANTKIEDNQFNIAINNPADNQVVASIAGDRWNGTLNFNYNPNSDKTLFTNGLDLYATNSTFLVTGKGAGSNVFLRSGATGNTLIIGGLSSAASYDIFAASGTNPKIVGTVAGVVSGLNFTEFYSASAGGIPGIQAKGADTNIPLDLRSQGASPVRAMAHSGSVEVARFTANTSNAVNGVDIRAYATGSPPQIQAYGTDTNIDLMLVPKGTGNVRLGTHSALAGETVTGYITIKDAGGTARKLAVVS